MAQQTFDMKQILQLLEQGLPFAGIPTFMKMPHTREVEGADLVIMGVPFDNGTANRSGTRFGPRAIREQSVYASSFMPFYPWSYDLTQSFRLLDFGDVVPIPGAGAVEMMLELTEAVATEIFAQGASLLTLGGDHTLPFGPIRAAAKAFGKLALVHLDAHQDSESKDIFGQDITMINHGTFATELVKEGHIDLATSTQLYIRTSMPQTPGGGYHIVYANEALQLGPEHLAAMIKQRVGEAPVYITLDVDALDPAFAPGNGSPVPGGPSTGEVRRLLQGLDGLHIIGADIVEVNPLYDPAQTTAIAAAFLAVDLLYLMGNARRKMKGNTLVAE